MWSNTSMCACPSSSLIESRFVELIPFSPLFLVSWDDNPKNDKRIVGFDGKNRGGTIGSQTCFVTWEYGSSVGCCLLLRRRGRELEHPWATFLLSLLFSRQEKKRSVAGPVRPTRPHLYFLWQRSFVVITALQSTRKKSCVADAVRPTRPQLYFSRWPKTNKTRSRGRVFFLRMKDQAMDGQKKKDRRKKEEEIFSLY